MFFNRNYNLTCRKHYDETFDVCLRFGVLRVQPQNR